MSSDNFTMLLNPNKVEVKQQKLTQPGIIFETTVSL